MATPMEIIARHGDESKTAHRINRNHWYWVGAAAVLILALLFLMARTAAGPGATQGKVAAGAANIQAGVAPGVGATYAGQPGGLPDGTPAPSGKK
jgi:bacteriorhodopsin